MLRNDVGPVTDFCFIVCRIQKELADITLDPPPNCRWASLFDLKSVVCPLVYSLGEHWSH